MEINVIISMIILQNISNISNNILITEWKVENRCNFQD